ncbi:MAG: glycosyltransferase family 2 protein [Actinomycetota bacterium]
MSDSPSIGIIIVSYNTCEPLRACLTSLAAAEVAGLQDVVVVDNASTDDTMTELPVAFPAVTFVDAGANVGFARGCNLGARHTDADLLVFLNPDTLVPSGAIEALVDAYQRRPDAGQIGGRTFDDSGTLDPSSCWGAPSLWSTLCFATGLSVVFRHHPRFDPESLGGWERDSERDVGVVTGCLCLMPRAVFEHVGGFDERYFLYGEDIDLSMRVREAGFSTFITPEAAITHSVGAASASSVQRTVFVLTGRMTVYRLRFNPINGFVLRVLYVVGIAVRAALPPQASGSGTERRSAWRPALRRIGEWWPGYRASPGRS